MTMLTDYVLGGLSAVLGVLLLGEWRGRRERPVLWWMLAFFAISVATFAGGTYHGFTGSLSPATLKGLWRITTFSVGIGSFCLLTSVFYVLFAGKLRKTLIALALVKLLVYLAWMTSHDDFSYVIADYGTSMMIILLLAIANWKKMSFRWIAAGIAVSFFAAGVQQARLGFGPSFDHDAVYHIIQMGGMVLLYLGGRLLRERVAALFPPGPASSAEIV